MQTDGPCLCGLWFRIEVSSEAFSSLEIDLVLEFGGIWSCKLSFLCSTPFYLLWSYDVSLESWAGIFWARLASLYGLGTLEG